MRPLKKEDENFNRRNTLSILRIKLKLHCVQNVESDTEIGEKGAFFKCLIVRAISYTSADLETNRVLVLLFAACDAEPAP